jgi:uncharacterized protein (UPF0332 family)
MAGTKQDYIEYRVLKAKEILADARLLADNNRWNSCVNRLYYSSFYMVTALLYKQEINTETHNGAKTQFFMHFVKVGIVSKEYGKLYSNLFDWRQVSDYADFIDFQEETVKPFVDKVAMFNALLADIIGK